MVRNEVGGKTLNLYRIMKTKKEIAMDNAFFEKLDSLSIQSRFSSDGKINDIAAFFEKFTPYKLEVVKIEERHGEKNILKERHHILYTLYQNKVYKIDLYFEYEGSFAKMACNVQKEERLFIFPFYKRVGLKDRKKLYPNGYISMFDYLNQELNIFRLE
jgi:hypothetical protein